MEGPINSIVVHGAGDYEGIINLAIDSLSSEHSKQAYRKALDDFIFWYMSQGQPGLIKATVNRYKAYLIDRGFTPASVNLKLSAIRKLAKEAVDNGLLGQAEAGGIASIRGVTGSTLPRGRGMASGELQALMACCENDSSPAGVRDAALIALAYSCGLRRAEIVGLDLEDYDTTSGRVLVRHGKGNKERTAYLVNGAARAMADWLAMRADAPGALFWPINKGGALQARRMTTQAVYNLTLKRGELAGVKDFSPHDLRRSFVGDLLDAGADIATVARMAGHASVTTTQRYDRRPEAAKEKAAGLLHVPYHGRLVR